jgi:hypothetical protein
MWKEAVVARLFNCVDVMYLNVLPSFGGTEKTTRKLS